MARAGVVVGVEKVVVAMGVWLGEIFDVELVFREEVPFSDVGGFVADGLEEFRVGDLAVAEV